MTFTLPVHVESHGAPQGAETDTYLLLHGYGGSSFSWRTWTPSLEERGHVVLVDLKGFGSAPKPDDGLYAPADQAELVHRLILQRDLRNLTLVGHSMGGAIALVTALRLLDEGAGRLRRLVLLAGAGYRHRLPPFVALARWERLATGAMRLLGTRRVIRAVLRSIVRDPGGITRSQVEGYAEPLDSAEARKALIRTALQIVPDDLDAVTARYPQLDVPTLLLWGRQDRVVPLSVGEALAQALPQATLVVLEECGHLPAEELPAASLAVLAAFLEGRDPAAALSSAPQPPGRPTS